MTKTEIDAKMEDIIEFSEVRDFIDTPVKRYSSGMYVKLAFSVAAHLDSEIMIMDEVLAVGDMAFQQKCLKKMREAASTEGRTVLYVSHNMNTIRQLCSRCIVLDKGKIIFEGNTEEAISVYMGFYSSDNLSYDYTNLPRNRKQNDKVKLLGLDIINRQYNKIQRGLPLELILHCEVNEDINNVCFRFEFYYSDGTIVGSAFSDKGIDVKKGHNIDVQMAIDTTNFAEGKYYAIALAYEYDEAGNQIHTDRVEPALFFETTSNENDKLIWQDHRFWGSVRFNDIRIESSIVY
jgi:lipopolysaccharide transport system ATP-binding protein